MIQKVNTNHLGDVYSLWKKLHDKDSMLIDTPSEEMFHHIVQGPNNMSFIYLDNDTITGFISGSVQNNKGYLTILLVDQTSRRQHIGSILLTHLEHNMKESYQNIEDISISFRNPVPLSWTSNHPSKPHHPMLPGVPNTPALRSFFTANGYDSFATQQVYYRNIEDHRISHRVVEKETRLEHQAITIEQYNETAHKGLNNLFDNLGSPTWKRDVLGGIQKDYPLLVVIHKSTVIGFAGPLYIEPTGRGYFAGIGVHDNYRNQGVASVLFARLCHSLSKMNASYMTLFTGTNNPARFVYKKEGFEQIETFINYRKGLRHE